jgi:hypothetical protein
VAGYLLVAGPVIEQPDPRLRGMCIYRTGSVERARELASADPAVINANRATSDSVVASTTVAQDPGIPSLT